MDSEIQISGLRTHDSTIKVYKRASFEWCLYTLVALGVLVIVLCHKETFVNECTLLSHLVGSMGLEIAPD